VNYGAGTRPSSIGIADLDGDGDQDLAVANARSNNVSVLLGTIAETSVYGTTDGQPGLFLGRPSPSPFAGRTSVEFDIPEGADMASLAVYSVDGRLVRELAGGRLAPGRHLGQWDGRDAHGIGVPSGVYFLRLQADEAVRTGKALLVR
jgi:flagellar hook assembly protein FlgD